MSIATRFSAHTLLSAFTVSGREAGADLAAAMKDGPEPSILERSGGKLTWWFCFEGRQSTGPPGRAERASRGPAASHGGLATNCHRLPDLELSFQACEWVFEGFL